MKTLTSTKQTPFKEGGIKVIKNMSVVRIEGKKAKGKEALCFAKMVSGGIETFWLTKLAAHY